MSDWSYLFCSFPPVLEQSSQIPISYGRHRGTARTPLPERTCYPAAGSMCFADRLPALSSFKFSSNLSF